MGRPGTWKTGQSGNPNGRPLCPLRAAIREELAKKRRRTLNGVRRTYTKNEILLNVLFEKAEGGDLKALQMIMDRGFGTPVQSIDVMGDIKTNGGPAVSLGQMQQMWKQETAKAMMEIQTGGNGKNGGKNGR